MIEKTQKKREILNSLYEKYEKKMNNLIKSGYVLPIGWQSKEILLDPMIIDKFFSDKLLEMTEEDHINRACYLLRMEYMKLELRQALLNTRLSEREKTCLECYYLKNMTLDKIALGLGISRRNVSVYIMRAIKKIRKYIERSKNADKRSTSDSRREERGKHVGRLRSIGNRSKRKQG